MLSVPQSYSRLFRPWDASGDVKKTSQQVGSENNAKLKKQAKRDNRLRKIRGNYKKPIDQDCTISTTTLEDQNLSLESPVASLTECCDRLLNSSPKHEKKPSKLPKTSRDNSGPQQLNHQPVLPPQEMLHFPPELYQGYVPELLPPPDLVHALGLQPTDPLLLESLAQGYAMEMEYARILHEENQAKLLNARKQRPKKYKCPHCQVGFSNNGQLKGHIRIHTGERPFKCDDKSCGKTFTRNEELTRHKRIHSGLRPYACPSCGKKFGRRDHLKKHTRTHLVQAERLLPVFLPLGAMPHAASFPYLYGY